MSKIFDEYFFNPKKHKDLTVEILQITDYICDFYNEYISLGLLIYGNDFAEVCYPLFLSLNFNLIKNHVDQLDKVFYAKKHRKQESSNYGVLFNKEIASIEKNKTDQIKTLIQKYKEEKSLPPPKLTQEDIIFDFGKAFFTCSNALIEKHGSKTTGLMSAGFIEVAFTCIFCFVKEQSYLQKIQVCCLEIQREIFTAIEDYKRNKQKMDLLEN